MKSAKDKRLDEVEATIKTIDNAAKINDWVAISNGAFRRFSWMLGADLARSFARS